MSNQQNAETVISKKSPFYKEFFQILTKHPFITTAVICLMCGAFTTGEKLPNIAVPVFISVAAVLILVLWVNAYIKNRENKKTLTSVLLIILLPVTAVLFYLFITISDSRADILLNLGLVVLTGVFIYLSLTDRLTAKNIILLIFAAGFLVRLAYVMYTPITVRQHDVNLFTSKTGHAAYIRYLYENNHLPDFDVRTKWQFYHPPVHHILAAVWLKVQTTVGIGFEHACENIQLLTLFYSSACMIISYKIFRQLNLKKSGITVAVAIVSFCPAFFILAGSINNDILSITFMLGAILNTIYWYKNQKLRYIVSIALCVGLGMMTKLSVWMTAPAIAFVFIYVFFKKIKNFKKYLAQFTVFGVICVPLGLWWSIRNLVKYGVPITYVPMLSENSDQYVGDIPLLQRLFDFNFSQFTDVGDQFERYGGTYNEYNPLVGLFKTSMFDEGITVNYYPNIAVFNKLLFWSAVILGIVGFISMAVTFIKKNTVIDFPMKAFIFLIYSVIFVSYYVFCIEFEHVCTQNIRYAVPLIVIGAYFTGLSVQHFTDKKPKLSNSNIDNSNITLSTDGSGAKSYYTVLKTALFIVVFVFCVSSVLVYDIVVSSSGGISQ